MTPEDYAKILSHSQIFNGVELQDLVELVQKAKVLQPKPGSILIEEGYRVTGLHVILEGSAHVMKGGNKVSILGRGSFFGEISLFGVALGATASIVVGNDRSTILMITQEVLDTWAKAHPASERLFLRKMCTELSRRFYSVSER